MTSHRATLAWTVGILLIAGCGRLQTQESTPVAESTPAVAEPSVSPSNAPTLSRVPDPYTEAINTASSAFQLGQSARSQDDWSLVASRWRQAVSLLSAVPTTSPSYDAAQTKLAEYRRNLAYAEQQANRPIGQSSDVVVVSPSRTPGPLISSETAARPQSRPEERPPATAALSAESVFVAPIVARAGGTPVINVRFNGDAVFPMIVDTGASGTLITADMATALNVQPTGEAKVDTASQRNLSLKLGYVESIEVEGAIAQNVLVAIAGPELDIGLLGHDFFGDYDITVRQDVVEFHQR